MLFNTLEEQVAHGSVKVVFGPEDDSDDESSQSWLGVPILIGELVSGVICLQDPRQNIYKESDVRLLSTLAAGLGTALENARLFNETQRLLEETGQRNNELAILNSVGEAMAKTLDVKTITRIVGDKVRDIFDSEVVAISLFDEQSNMIIGLYEFDNGEGGYIDTRAPFPLGKGLSSKVILTRQPVMLGTLEDQNANGAYIPPELMDQGSG